MAGRRPRDRKQQILAAASELFRERGYHNVSVADVTKKVDIGASALYRHYSNKNALLYATVLNGVDELQGTVDGAADLDAALRALTDTIGDRRGLPVLWQREARYLDGSQRADLRTLLRSSTDRLDRLLAEQRPELDPADRQLLVLSILATLSSNSAVSGNVPRYRLEHVMLQMVHRVAATPLGAEAPGAGPSVAGVELPLSRREQILTEAIRLFDERGYQNVLTEDIGEACGITGPNLYNHFESKTDLLTTAATRGFDRRTTAVRDAVAGSPDPESALEALVRAHAEFAVANGHLVGLMTTELGELPDHHRRVSAQEQRDYLHIWNQVLAARRPELDRHTAHLLISATLTVLGNAARTRRLARPDLSERLVDIGMQILLTPDVAPATAPPG